MNQPTSLNTVQTCNTHSFHESSARTGGGEQSSTTIILLVIIDIMQLEIILILEMYKAH